ncbi:MAG: hypothetical protein A3H35_16470 [Betaproteobacteria bacterium RIFCSPLOWO2_02_FULL_62_17]|nr:MAG: hypothetical protein A3H35_16470 [Betaproteobacteria bacterium RIFCSPLOWO2_02_FULL_62_17]
MDISFASAVVVLLLVTDPIGNIPLFSTLLKTVEPARRTRVILRECLIAYGVLLVFVFFGERVLALIGVSDRSLNIAGGVILFLIALRMVFRSPEGPFGELPQGEPFIVPLAIPSLAGPTAIATVVLLASRAPERMTEWVVAVSVAMAVAALALVFADRVAQAIGERTLMALERLMGLVLTAIAVEMLLRGIEMFIKQQ